MEWKWLRECMGICITRDMVFHLTVLTLLPVLQSQPWELMGSFMAHNTSNMELIITRSQAAPYTPNQASNSQEVSASVALDQVTLPVESIKGNSNGIVTGSVNGNSGAATSRQNYPNSMQASNGSYGRGVLPPEVWFRWDEIHNSMDGWPHFC